MRDRRGHPMGAAIQEDAIARLPGLARKLDVIEKNEPVDMGGQPEVAGPRQECRLHHRITHSRSLRAQRLFAAPLSDCRLSPGVSTVFSAFP